MNLSKSREFTEDVFITIRGIQFMGESMTVNTFY